MPDRVLFPSGDGSSGADDMTSLGIGSHRHRLHGQVPCARVERRCAGVRRCGAPASSPCWRSERRSSPSARRASSASRAPPDDWRIARRRSGRRCGLHHHAQRLPSRDGDRGAGGGQACLVREADGDAACRCRADARGRARLRQGRGARLQLHPEPDRSGSSRGCSTKAGSARSTHVRVEMDEDFMADPEPLFYWKSEASPAMARSTISACMP